MEVRRQRLAIRSGSVFEIAADPEFEVMSTSADVIAPIGRELPTDAAWTFPAASVSAVELEVRAQART